MSVANAEFEEPGAEPGEALYWTRTVYASLVYATFTLEGVASGPHAVDVFQWTVPLERGSDELFTRADFDARTGQPKADEDFEDLWGARPARLLSAKQAPFILQPGYTLDIVVNGTPSTVTFFERDFANIADARAEEVARVIDRVLADADAFMAPSGRSVVIATTAAGYAMTLAVTGGTAADLFAFPASAQGQDEEGGTFFRSAEFDLLNFKPSAEEADRFADGWPVAKDPPVHDDAAVPNLLNDPYDQLGRLTIMPVDPFLPAAFIATLDTYTFTPQPELFEEAGYPGEVLTINWAGA